MQKVLLEQHCMVITCKKEVPSTCPATTQVPGRVRHHLAGTPVCNHPASAAPAGLRLLTLDMGPREGSGVPLLLNEAL